MHMVRDAGGCACFAIYEKSLANNLDLIRCACDKYSFSGDVQLFPSSTCSNTADELRACSYPATRLRWAQLAGFVFPRERLTSRSVFYVSRAGLLALLAEDPLASCQATGGLTVSSRLLSERLSGHGKMYSRRTPASRLYPARDAHVPASSVAHAPAAVAGCHSVRRATASQCISGVDDESPAFIVPVVLRTAV